MMVAEMAMASTRTEVEGAMMSRIPASGTVFIGTAKFHSEHNDGLREFTTKKCALERTQCASPAAQVDARPLKLSRKYFEDIMGG
jgi:hypothetical protein